MAIENDIQVAVNGDIRHYSGTATYTVLELHRYLQDLADQAAASGDDLLDITSVNPSERSTDNIITLNSPYNIDDVLAEYLYDGSITQGGGDTVYSGLVVVGSVYGTTTLQIVQNNVLYDGDTPFWGTGINTDPANNILCRMIVKTRATGADVDGKRIRISAREWSETYAEFSVTMGLGNSVAAIFTNNDLNNTTTSGVVATWTTITNVEGWQTIDLNNGDGPQPYYSQWNRATYTINQLYERAKYITRRGTAATIHGIDGELFRGVTHQVAWNTQDTGEFFVENNTLTWGTGATAGTGLILADTEESANQGEDSGTCYIQLLTGVAPTAAMTITEGACVATSGTVTSRSLSPVFIGVSTGTALIGAYGIGVEALDLSASDIVFDLSNTPRYPPNTVTFTVGGLVSGEDYVLVTPEDGSGGLYYSQMTLTSTLETSGLTQIYVTSLSGNIPPDTPTISGSALRVKLDTGVYRRIQYNLWSGLVFDTEYVDWSGYIASSGNNVFLGYIDRAADDTTESFQTKFATARTLFIRVRDGGGATKGDTPIKSFETVGTLGTAGGTATAIRTPDA